MEVLATITGTGTYYFLLCTFIVFIAILFCVFISGVVHVVQYGLDIDALSGMLALVILMSMLTFFTFDIYSDGPQVKYKAKITDFNEVYNNGYKVVSHEGEIYTLIKK
jgi:hypothetical protein